MAADKTAMGTLPTAGFQYCDALTTASSYGMYVFPPRDLSVRWRGSHFERDTGDGWTPLERVSIGESNVKTWKNKAPEQFHEHLPAFVQRFFVPDTIQVWSGLFVQSNPDWAIHIRPLANTITDRNILLYEGIVETDIFAPCPLFINIRFLSLDTVFKFEKFQPLFQMQPIRRDCYRGHQVSVEQISDTATESDFNWDGLGETVRIFTNSNTDLELGHYKKRVRKRNRYQET